MTLIGSPFADSILIGYRAHQHHFQLTNFSRQHKSTIKSLKQSKVIKLRHKANQAQLLNHFNDVLLCCIGQKALLNRQQRPAIVAADEVDEVSPSENESDSSQLVLKVPFLSGYDGLELKKYQNSTFTYLVITEEWIRICSQNNRFLQIFNGDYYYCALVHTHILCVVLVHCLDVSPKSTFQTAVFDLFFLQSSRLSSSLLLSLCTFLPTDKSVTSQVLL